MLLGCSFCWPGSSVINLNRSGVSEVWLLIVLVPGFRVWCLFGCRRLVARCCPVCPGAHRLRPRRGGPPFRVAGMVRAGQAGAGRAQSRCQQVRKASFQGQSGLIFEDPLRGRGGRAGRAGARSGSGACPGRRPGGPRRRSRPRRRVQAARSAAMFAARTQPQLTCQVFDGRFRRPMALAVRTPPVSTTACSRCSDVDVLGVVAAGDAADPGAGDVRADDGVPPAGLLLVGGQVPQPAGGTA